MYQKTSLQSKQPCVPGSTDVVIPVNENLASPRPDADNPKLPKALRHRLKRARALLILAAKLRLPMRQKLADKMWSAAKPHYLASPLLSSGLSPHAENPKARSWQELKILGYVYSCYEQHEAYERLLAAFDSVTPVSVRQETEKASFIGSGSGDSTLNCYRALKMTGRVAGDARQFEKVYRRRDNDDLERVKALNAFFGPSLSSGQLFMPRIIEIREGSELAIIYSRLTPGARISKSQAVVAGGAAVRMLMALPVQMVPLDSVLRRPHPQYINAHTITRDWIAGTAPQHLSEFDAITDWVEQKCPRFLAHGDLHRKNILASGAMLDWDSCGIYPIGYDPGLILARGFGGRTVDELESDLIDHFGGKEDNRILVNAGLFYTLVFGVGKRSVLGHRFLSSLLTRVLERMEKTEC